MDTLMSCRWFVPPLYLSHEWTVRLYQEGTVVLT
jgi:hypothetical protein